MQPEATTDKGKKMIQTTDPINSEKQGTRKEPAKPAPKKTEVARRGTTLPPELRDLQKVIDAFAKEFSFAPNEVTKFKTKMALVIEAWRRAEARHRDEHHQVRAKLNTKFNGRIERWIYEDNDEELKAFFRRVWRD
jgi:hypothetical protein